MQETGEKHSRSLSRAEIYDLLLKSPDKVGNAIRKVDRRYRLSKGSSPSLKKRAAEDVISLLASQGMPVLEASEAKDSAEDIILELLECRR